MQRRTTLHSPKHVLVAVAGVALLAGTAAPLTAIAASTPPATTSALQAALAKIDGSSPSQVQALIQDLTELSDGQPTPTLGSDLDAVLAPLSQASGQPATVQPVLTAIEGLLGTTTPTTAGVAATVMQLENLAGLSGISAPVGDALSQLASGLTGADLPALLGQVGSPLTPAAVQQVVSDLAGLENVPVGGTIAAGALSAVGQALDTIASQPGVPATAASALDTVAGVLGSQNPITPSTLGAALATLQGALPALATTPLTGSAFDSVASGLDTVLAASPPASGAGGGSTGYVEYLQSPSPAVAVPVTGATISSFKYRKRHAIVTVACPAATTGNCTTMMSVKIKNGKLLRKQLKTASGKSHTARLALPRHATAIRKHPRTMLLKATAVTGTYSATDSISVHIK